MNKLIFNTLVLFVASLLLSCQSHKQTSIDVASRSPVIVSGTVGEVSIECKSPRRQMCTREYRPVCATRDNGVRCVTTPCLSTEQVTKSNACAACADEKVFSYIKSACS